MNEPRNPYAPPTSHVSDREEPQDLDSGRFVPYGRSRPAGRGAGWIGDAWRILKAQPGMWAAALLLMFVAWMVVSMIPLVSLFTALLVPFVYAAIALAADEQRRMGTFELKVLWSSFEKRPAPLLAVGGVSLLAGILFVVVLMIFLGSDIFSMVTGASQADPELIFSKKFWLVFLIGIALMLPITCATYMAPQLIVLHDQPVIEALKMSLFACIKNILPGIVFGVLALVLFIVSMIPLLLGLIITLPILAITNYTVYRDIFVEEDAGQELAR
jgi:uncharacterized membrane protein